MATGAVRTVASIAAGRHAVITRKQAASSGFSAHNVTTAKDRGWLTEEVPGVLVIAGSPPTWRQRVSIALAPGEGAAAASHRSASALQRFDGFPDPDAGGRARAALPSNARRLSPARPVPIDVQVEQPRWYALPAELHAQLHQASALDHDLDVVVIDGLPCTSVARTLADLGAMCTDEQVWKALISARRIHRLDPRWLSETARRLDRPGPTGAPTIRRLLRRWAGEHVLPESWLEELMLRMLDDPTLPPLERQHVVLDRAGDFVARVDAAMPAAKLAFEAHSRDFHFGPQREAADEDRDLRLMREGYEVVYLGWYATRSPAQLLPTIRRIVHDRLALHAPR